MNNYVIKDNTDNKGDCINYTKDLYWNGIRCASSDKIEKHLAYIYFSYLSNKYYEEDTDFNIQIQEKESTVCSIVNDLTNIKKYYDEYKDRLMPVWAGVNIPPFV